MKSKRGLTLAVAVGALVAGCATTGTRVSTTSESYRDIAKSQQAWCGTFGNTCTCSIDGVQATCSLVYACLNTGNCRI